jgi:hypothetical protein
MKGDDTVGEKRNKDERTEQRHVRCAKRMEQFARVAVSGNVIHSFLCVDGTARKMRSRRQVFAVHSQVLLLPIESKANGQELPSDKPKKCGCTPSSPQDAYTARP